MKVSPNTKADTKLKDGLKSNAKTTPQTKSPTISAQSAAANTDKANAAKKASTPAPKKLEEPAYVVSIEARPLTEAEAKKSKAYSPEEIKSKAKAFLMSGSLPPEQAEVLKTILDSKEAGADSTKK